MSDHRDRLGQQNAQTPENERSNTAADLAGEIAGQVLFGPTEVLVWLTALPFRALVWLLGGLAALLG